MEKSQLEDIFDSPAIKLLEYKILRIESRCRGFEKLDYSRPDKEEIVRHLLDVRKVLLDDSFIMDDENRELLIDCNKAFTELRGKVKTNVRKLFDTAVRSNTVGDVSTGYCCRLSRHYPNQHPIQTVRAKKMWQVLTGSSANDEGFMNIREYDHHYNIHGVEVCSTLYSLYDYSPFSLYDILWVRSFDTEIYAHEKYSNYEQFSYYDKYKFLLNESATAKKVLRNRPLFVNFEPQPLKPKETKGK